MANQAFILLSGGQDSATCLFWAKENWRDVEAVNVRYGQRHVAEINAAAQVAELAQVPLMCYNFPVLTQIGDSALVGEGTWEKASYNGLPASFVPGRNDFLLSILAVHAYKKQREGPLDLIIGVCQTDYSGYPDCREKFIQAKQTALCWALDRDVRIYTPLMAMTKADTVRFARSLGPTCWDALSYTLTCYEGVQGGCGSCPACVLRVKGFAEAGEVDPAYARSQNR